VLLAKALKMTFTDTDLLIQNREGRYLQDIINSDGISKFLSIEEAAVLDLNVKNHVIATGGSVIYSAASIEHLKRDGGLIYLKLGYKEIERRIRNIKSRGIAMSEGQSLMDLYSQRTPLYEKYADIIINCSGKHMEEVVSELSEKFI
jgi:shikimate kinase